MNSELLNRNQTEDLGGRLPHFVRNDSEPIIQSLLWTDLYKLTMGQAVMHQFAGIDAQYEFINRGKHQFPNGFGEKLTEQIAMMAQLSLTDSDRQFLETKSPYLSQDYVNYLSDYHFNPDEVKVEQTDGDLKIDIEGPWERTIYWEVPLMALICELYYKETGQNPDGNYVDKARQKGRLMREAQALLLEFGTRRAFSNKVHRDNLGALIETAGLPEEGGVLLGTSNVALAKEFGLNASGTFAHEWVMAHAALNGNLNAHRTSLEDWADEYLGRDGGIAYPKLGTALTDTFTTEAFLRDLTAELANFYTFFRQDSGEPVDRGELIVARLNELGIDPLTKGVAFTDGLDIPRAIAINEHFKGITQRIFGIGTDITNDVGVRPMNIVIKAHAFRKRYGLWLPAVKLSDDRGKESGDKNAVRGTKDDFGVKEAA